MKPRVLIIDDEELIRWSLKDALAKAGYEVFEAESGVAGLEIMGTKSIALLILDMVLPGEDGLSILKQIKDADEGVQVIMITAFGSIETAVEAIKFGAYDFMTKPFNLEEVVLKVERALKNAGLVRELGQFKKIQEVQFSKEKIVFESRSMGEIAGQIQKINDANVDIVLITGETGTGKGLIAKTIHKTGSRARGPFVTLNCTAIPDNLLESELFGYERGAFTDAKVTKEGVVEQARGGTLFLDEIGDLPPKLQGKLLRFIEEKRIRRLGGKKEINVDVKLVSATNRNLQEAMRSGEFRSDLYHRLNLIQIHIPPLRDRKEDIIPLASFFLKEYAAKYGKNVEGFTEDAYPMLTSYSWPGNVRELSNVLERSLILENTRLVDRSQIIRYLVNTPDASRRAQPEIDFTDMSGSFEKIVNDYKRYLLKHALSECNHNKAKAADLLKMDRSTFNYQLKVLNIN